MAQFRKKPVVIDAVQWDGRKFKESGMMRGAPLWLALACATGKIAFPEGHGDELAIMTLEDGKFVRAEHVASPGDWIIRGVQGELYPCKPDIFAATYEAV